MLSRKKLVCLFFATVLLCSFGFTYSIWNEQLFTEENTLIDSGQINSSEKYFTFSAVYDGETLSAYSVNGYEGLIDTLIIPRVHLNKPVISVKSSFSNNSLIREIVIPDTVIIIEANAFMNFTRLQKVTVLGEEKTLAIGNYAFMNCVSLTEFNMNSNRLLSIAVYSFYNTDKIIRPSI